MSKRHILVVDDDMYISQMVNNELLDQGFEVTLAASSTEAKVALRNPKHIDVVILDHFLPDETGVALLTAMSQDDHLQKPPVILSSSYVDPKNTAWGNVLRRLPPLSRSLIRAYLPKPYSWEKLDDVFTKIFTSGDH